MKSVVSAWFRHAKLFVEHAISALNKGDALPFTWSRMRLKSGETTKMRPGTNSNTPISIKKTPKNSEKSIKH